MKKLFNIFTLIFLFVATFVAQAQTTHLVTSAADSGPNTLRDIINGANSGDIINFDASLNGQVITLNTRIVIDKSLRIQGNSPSNTIIRKAGVTDGAFLYTGSGRLSLNWLTLGGGAYSLFNIGTNPDFHFSLCNFETEVKAWGVGKLLAVKCNFLSTVNYSSGLGIIAGVPLNGADSYIIQNCNFTTILPNATIGNSLAINTYSQFSNTILTVKVIGCKFYNNTTATGVISYTIKDNDHLYIDDCSFDDNTVLQSGNGSAISCYNNHGGKLTVSNSFFRGNSQSPNPSTQGILVNADAGYEINFYQNVITGNNGSNIITNGNLSFIQNTMAHNYGTTLTGSSLKISNSILAGVNYSFPINRIFSLGGNYLGTTYSWAQANDITTAATLAFVSPVTTIPSSAGNYRLQSNSSCLGAGINANVPQDLFDSDNDGNTTEAMPFDIVGNNRVARHSIFSSFNIDIGAYERPLNGGGLRAENIDNLPNETTKLSVYPNPAQDIIHVDYSFGEATTATCTLYNLIGQIAYQENLTSNKTTTSINVANLEKGLYLLQITNNKGETQSQKVVVQ